MSKYKLLPPEKITFKDILQILLGLVMIPLGLVILYNALTRGIVGPALLIGGAFLVFGIYRSVSAWGRWRWYQQLQGVHKHD